MKIQVKEFMSAPVVTMSVDGNVAYARELMERKDVSAIPVVELGGGHIKVRGIVSLYDLTGVTDETIPIAEVMSTGVSVIPPDASAIRAATLMLEHGIHHLVVMEKGRITGMVSSMDFVRLVAEQKLNRLANVIFI